MASSPAECLCLSVSWMNEKDNFIVDCKRSRQTVFKLVCPQWKHREVHRSAHGYDRLGRRHRMRRQVTEQCTHTIDTGVVSGVVFSRLLSRLLSDKAVYLSDMQLLHFMVSLCIVARQYIFSVYRLGDRRYVPPQLQCTTALTRPTLQAPLLPIGALAALTLNANMLIG